MSDKGVDSKPGGGGGGGNILKENLLLGDSSNKKHHSNSDSSLSQDGRGGGNNVSKSLDFGAPIIISSAKSQSHNRGREIVSASHQEVKLEMQDFSIKSDKQQSQNFGLQRFGTNAQKSKADMQFKSSSSFNQSDEEDLVREGSPGDKNIRSPPMRITSNFGGMRGDDRFEEESKSAAGHFSNLIPINKFTRTASNMNPSSSNPMTNSLTRPLQNLGGTTPINRGIHSSLENLNISHNRLPIGPGLANQGDITNIEDPAKRAQKRQRIYRSIVQFNYSETLILFLLMLNAIIQPNYVTSLYFLYSLLMTSMNMTRNLKVIKTKFTLSICLIIITAIIFGTKCVLVFLMLKDKKIPTFTDEDLLFYKNFGILINKKLNLVDNFQTLFFDSMECFLAIAITIVYRQHYNDVPKPQGFEEGSSKLLNPYFFDRHLDRLCQLALIALTVETIFVQTIIQAFILILIIIMIALWAHSYNDERQQLRYLILTFSQMLLLIQLIGMFGLQIPEVKHKVVLSDIAMILDLFGLLLHNLKLYAIILHLLAVSFAIQIIQLYKQARQSSIKNGPIVFPEEEIDAGKSDNTYNNIGPSGGKNTSHKRTLLSSHLRLDKGVYKSATGLDKKRASVVNRIREKTMGVKHRLHEQMVHDESHIHQVAQKYYIHFSPQIWLWFCRVAIFVWSYAYHDYQSLFMLMWIMHSTLFKSTRRFIHISITYYLPIFICILLFYYIINIPRVVEFQNFGKDSGGYDANLDKWRSYGFYQFSTPSLEITLMMIALAPFFLLTKVRKQLDENAKENTKKKFLEKLTDQNAPTLYYLTFVLIKNLDLLAFVTIFFSGVNKIDFYHIFLIFFFVAYILNPRCFIRNYIILLVYVDFFVFEKYLYTLIIHYIPQDSLYIKIASVLGLSTDYNDTSDNKYFKYPPKFQQWILIMVVFLQYQIHQILKDEELIKSYTNNATDNFKKRYPRIFHIWEIIQHLKKEFLILIAFAIFFMIIILTTKSVINWGFQIILCIFIITYVGVGNHLPQSTGLKRLSKVWFLMIWYSSLILILQITYQFAALPIVRQALEIDQFLDMLPLWIRKNIGIIGFTVYSTYIWEQFLIYLIYFAVGVYVRKAMNTWKEEKQVNLAAAVIGINISRNSDMQQRYDDQEQIVDWNKEHQKIRFTTPYLVYKLKPLWIVVDQISQSLFVLTSVMIMVLSNYWQISLSMAIHLTCFIYLCLNIASALYKNRKSEKKNLNSKNENKERVTKHLTEVEMGNHWTNYKKTVNILQIKLRARIWLFQFILTLLCMVIIYPTEFIYQIRGTFIDEQRGDIVNILDYMIFYMFWGGVYHSPYKVDHHGYFYNFYGYVIILLLLIFEKNGQLWSLDRFGCTSQLQAHFKQVDDNVNRIKAKKLEASLKNQKKEALGIAIQEQVIQEDDKEHESNSDQRSRYMNDQDEERKSIDDPRFIDKSQLTSRYSKDFDRSPTNRNDVANTPQDDLKKEELQDLLQKWIMKKYRIKLLNGVKILLEDSIQLLLLISSVYKDSIIGLILLFGVFIYMMRRKIKQMQRLAWIVGLCMVLQYGLALSNLTSDNNPMDFPSPFNPYPKDEHDEGRFIIPWYRKISLLKNNFDWAMYLGMGISNTKLNGLWIDYFIMGCIQVHLYYFGCQLFNVDLKIKKGEELLEKLDKFCHIIHKEQRIESTPERKKKEYKKLKNKVMLHNIYKYLQTSIFMHFHQVTIVVTLLLAVLARSLFSFGYIIVCMIMIYENHKFFTPDQKNFKLQSVLKFWLQPYVLFDLTLQLAYQIPLQFLHRDQDLGIKWCWQNIIGFQDIWIKDVNNVDEMVVRSIMFIILKAFTYYFVTLQIQIFASTAYRKYIKRDFQKFKDMAETKGMGIIWRHNNMKIQKIKQQEQENHKMNDMLANLKRILKNWQAQYNLDAAAANNNSGTNDTTDIKKDEVVTVIGGVIQPAVGGVTNNQSLISNQVTQNLNNKQSFRDDRVQTTGDLIDNLGNTGNQNHKSKKLRALTLAMTQDIKNSPHKVRPQVMIIPTKTLGGDNTSASNLDNSEAYEHFSLDDEELLEKAKNKLGFFANTLLYFKKELTEQIVFISSDKYLKKVATDLQGGKTNIYTKFERKMLSDIREYKNLQKEGTNVVDIEIKDMPRTMELIKLSKLIQQYTQLLVEVIGTYSDYVCYLFMIISMMKNAGLISVVYPFVVFGYSLLEEINPRKKIWYGLLIYTEVLILIKFVYQLSFWEAIFWEDQLQRFQDFLNAIHMGLERKASGQFGDMLAYFLPEILILFSIMSHIQKEIMIGLLYLKEDHIETIKEALVRYLQYNKVLESLVRSTVLKKKFGQPNTTKISNQHADEKKFIEMVDLDHLINIYDMDVFNTNFDKDIKRFERKHPLPRRHSHFDLQRVLYKEAYPEMQVDYDPNNYQEADQPNNNEYNLRQNDAELQRQPFKKKIKAASMVDQDELDKIFLELLEQNKIAQDLNMNIVNKAEFSIKKLLYQNAYFEKLFPSIKEQKPGNDFYAIIATFQFLICLFLIFFYTKMDADVTITSDSMTYNQFSGQMVIALFLQILVMIIDRYNYKSKTFISVQEKQQQRQHQQQQMMMGNVQPASGEVVRYTAKSQEHRKERGQSFIDFMQGKKSVPNHFGDGFMEDERNSQSSNTQEEERERIERLEKQIVLEKTIITLSIVSKFYLQWFLLIVVHVLVFWFFPIHGNLKLQNNPNCVGGGVCNEFGGNPALIIFYILYCCYFWVSALQIRYGVPEMKKGNFMMNNYNRLNKFTLQGFMAIPFLFELKTFVDWTFTRTALDVFQWFILSSTHAELFIARCVQGRYQRKPLGRQVPWFEKVGLGGFGQLFIVLLIAGPLLLFSNFNPISTPNPVTNSLIKLNIIVEPKDSLAKNTINLFTNNYVTQLTQITQFQYDKMQFANDARTKSYDQNLVQYIKMNNYADANWAASLPNRLQLKKEFENTNSTTSLSISLAYAFDRANPNAPQASNEVVQPLKVPGMDNVLRGFTKIFSLDCDNNKSANSTLFIPPFFTGVHYLNDKEKAQNDTNKNHRWTKGLRVFYSCENYWKVDQYFNCSVDPKDDSVCPEGRIPGQNLTGVSFYTFSTKIAPSYFKYSIITFYVSIVLVIGKLFRNVCIIPANRIFIWEIPNSEKLLLLCECIYIYRMRSQLDQEEQLYFTFADIMRSPEMIKAITGSSMKKKTQ